MHTCELLSQTPRAAMPRSLLSTLFLLLAAHAAAVPSLPASEADTLFAIMDSLSSDQPWRASYPAPCRPDSTWQGLECRASKDSNGVAVALHVSRLDFGNPPFPTCKKTASFPPLVFALPGLRSVFFFNCFTASNTNLSLPRTLRSSSLQQLSLRSNPALVGEIPRRIASLNSLKILTLSQNRLSGEIPDEVFALTSLVHVDLSYNALAGAVSSRVGSLVNLVGLDLSYNELSGPIPHAIGELRLLQKLDLSSNLLSGGIPDTIGKLSELVFMALSNNNLSGRIPKGIEGLESLQYLIMDGNPMSIPLPAGFGNLPRLQELQLADSGYSGDIPDTFCRLRNLSTLSLQNNRLTGAIPRGFGDLAHIYHLNLSRNSLGGTVPFNSSFLSRLGRNLDLSGNSGLCLSSSEALSVKIGVAVCGANKSVAGLGKPLMAKSGASHSKLSCRFFVIMIFSGFGVLMV